MDRDMPILILGGGLIGLAIAHQLARRGCPVQVLSRRRSEAAGFVAAGMLAPHAEGLIGEQLQLGQASLAAYPSWVAEVEADSGLNCDLKPCGIVVPFISAAERDAYPTAPHGSRLDRHGLETEIPGIGEQWQAGLLFEQDGQIDNRRRLMRALERACTVLGVNFLEGAEVQTLHCSDAGQLERVQLLTAEGDQLQLPCENAVLSCGAWSAELLPGLPIFPVKGQMLSLQAPQQALGRVLFGPGTYLVQRDDGLLVVGATSEREAGFRAGLTPDGQKQLQQGICSLIPQASRWPTMERWWGFRPCTPDQGPLLGNSSVAGLWLATGHHRNGVLLAPITAQLLTAAILDGAKAPYLETFSWNRFI
jgi:glycine oxidase